MADPLAQFRKRPPATGTGVTPPAGTEDYVAFDTKDKVKRLRIRRAVDPTRAPGYEWLLDLTYDDIRCDSLVLVYTFMLVLVRGRNLLPVASAIEMGTADFIQEFDPDRWKPPADPNAPFIESIHVAMKDDGPALEDTERKGPSGKPH